MTNNADPEEANWSGSTLFAKVGHIQVKKVLCVQRGWTALQELCLPWTNIYSQLCLPLHVFWKARYVKSTGNHRKLTEKQLFSCLTEFWKKKKKKKNPQNWKSWYFGQIFWKAALVLCKKCWKYLVDRKCPEYQSVLSRHKTESLNKSKYINCIVG